jgi:hypothetical protein
MSDTHNPPYEPSMFLACSIDSMSHSLGSGASCELSADDAMESNDGKLEGESVTMKIVPLHIITLSMIENPDRQYIQ